MKQKNQLLGYLALIAGLALIFTGFFIFVPQEKRNDVFWLDLSVACLVFIVTTFTELGLFGINFDIEKQIGGLGIRLAYIRMYSFLAIAIIIIGYFAEAHFSYQLFIQLAAAFLLLMGYFFSHISSVKALSVQAEQDMERKGKDQILNAISQFEILITSNTEKFGAEKQKIDTIKETVRYLSPTNNQTANELDSEIASTLQQAYSVAKNNNDGRIDVFSLFDKCEELLKLRKNTYSN